MSDKCLLEIKQEITKIKEDIAAVKTDVAWIKRIIYLTILFICSVFGIDATGILT